MSDAKRQVLFCCPTCSYSTAIPANKIPVGANLVRVICPKCRNKSVVEVSADCSKPHEVSSSKLSVSPLQATLNRCQPNATLNLPPGEFFGQIVIDRPLVITGHGKKTWIGAPIAPTIRIESHGVILKNVMVESTLDLRNVAIDAACGVEPVLENVIIRGTVRGMLSAGNASEESATDSEEKMNSNSWERTSVPCQPNELTIAEELDCLFKEADLAEDRGDWVKVTEFYESLLQLSPGHLEAKKLLERARRRAGLRTSIQHPGHCQASYATDVDSRRSTLAAMFRGNGQRTGVYETQGICNVPRAKWKRRLDLFESPPVLEGGVVYVGTIDGILHALETDTGRTKWEFQTGARIEGSPAVADGRIYVGNNEGRLYCLDISNGLERHTFSTGRKIGSTPLVYGGVVYFTCADGFLRALDEESWHLKWEFNTGAEISASAAMSGDVVFVGNWAGYLHAIDSKTGNQVWEFRTKRALLLCAGIKSTPAIGEDVICFGTDHRAFYAVSLRSGTLLWISNKVEREINGSPAIWKDLVYYRTGLRYMHAVEIKTGRHQWRHECGDGTGRHSSPTVAAGTVYMPSRLGIDAVNAETGQLIWRYPYSGFALCNTDPVIGDGVLYVQTSGVLWALH